jgi:hypothetical protein
MRFTGAEEGHDADAIDETGGRYPTAKNYRPLQCNLYFNDFGGGSRNWDARNDGPLRETLERRG